MDFEFHYTEEQEQFRALLQAWLEDNAPTDLEVSMDGRPLDRETQDRLREFRLKLGAKGWLAPSWPSQWGGADLSPALDAVFREELAQLNLPSIGSNPRWIPAMLVWGTPEQKQRYVPPALRGEIITWQMFSESESGSDLSSMKTQAVRDGNSWVISGHKDFITGRIDPDYLCTVVVTDPERPQRLNLGVFMIDARLPGISIVTQDLLLGSERHVFLDGVRVPANCLIGSPFQGWEIVQTILEGEQGGQGVRSTEEATIQSVLEYLRGQGQSAE